MKTALITVFLLTTCAMLVYAGIVRDQRDGPRRKEISRQFLAISQRDETQCKKKGEECTVTTECCNTGCSVNGVQAACNLICADDSLSTAKTCVESTWYKH